MNYLKSLSLFVKDIIIYYTFFSYKAFTYGYKREKDINYYFVSILLMYSFIGLFALIAFGSKFGTNLWVLSIPYVMILLFKLKFLPTYFFLTEGDKEFLKLLMSETIENVEFYLSYDRENFMAYLKNRLDTHKNSIFFNTRDSDLFLNVVYKDSDYCIHNGSFYLKEIDSKNNVVYKATHENLNFAKALKFYCNFIYVFQYEKLCERRNIIKKEINYISMSNLDNFKKYHNSKNKTKHILEQL